MKITVVIADDHPALLAGIQHELADFHTISIVGVAYNSTDVVALLKTLDCDVLVTDYVMPGGDFGDGLEMLSFLRRSFPSLGIVVYTSIESPATVAAIARIGAGAVLSKVDAVSHLISAIHAVHAGTAYFSPKFRSPQALQAADAKNSFHYLTRRESEVVRLYAAGASVSEIAVRLNRSKQTISAQKSSAMRRLGIERDVDLFRFAFESGLSAEGGYARNIMERLDFDA
ncbi:MAG: response regulator [Achromobacter sp.]|uniref:response regulator n=1 Tax=Achromobacter sp. TaxID=134375 RepID=UPI003CFBCF6C